MNAQSNQGGWDRLTSVPFGSSYSHFAPGGQSPTFSLNAARSGRFGYRLRHSVSE